MLDPVYDKEINGPPYPARDIQNRNDDTSARTSRRRNFRWWGFYDIDPLSIDLSIDLNSILEDQVKEQVKQFRILMPERIRGFALKTKTWGSYHALRQVTTESLTVF
jgi:hypothetical protein